MMLKLIEIIASLVCADCILQQLVITQWLLARGACIPRDFELGLFGV